MKSHLTVWLRATKHRRPMIGRVWKLAEATATRLFGTALQFVAQFAVARLGGAVASGHLGLAQSWTTLLGAAFSSGAGPFTLRRLGANSDAAGRDQTVALGQTIALVGAAVGCAILLPLAIARPDLLGLSEAGSALAVTILLGSAGYAVLKVHIEHFKFRRELTLALFLEYSLPFLLVTIAALLAWMSWNSSVAPALAYCSGYLASGAVLAVQRRSLAFKTALKALRANRVELSSNVFVQAGGALLLALPVIWGARQSDTAMIGVFSVMVRLVGISSTISLVLNAYASANVARAAYAAPGSLTRTYFRYAAANFAVGGGYLMLLAIFPSYALALFGVEFVNPETTLVLRWFALAMLLKQAAGLPDLFLAMTGVSHLDAWSLFTALICVAIALIALNGSSIWSLTVAYAIGQTVRLWFASTVFLSAHARRSS